MPRPGNHFTSGCWLYDGIPNNIIVCEKCDFFFSYLYIIILQKMFGYSHIVNVAAVVSMVMYTSSSNCATFQTSDKNWPKHSGQCDLESRTFSWLVLKPVLGELHFIFVGQPALHDQVAVDTRGTPAPHVISSCLQKPHLVKDRQTISVLKHIICHQ